MDRTPTALPSAEDAYLVEDLRHRLMMIVSHATGGCSQDIDRSVNDICCDITRHRNAIYLTGKESALQSPCASDEVLGEVGDVEPFGYWVEQKHAEPILLRKPAYIPEPSPLRTVTPLYAAPQATSATATATALRNILVQANRGDLTGDTPEAVATLDVGERALSATAVPVDASGAWRQCTICKAMVSAYPEGMCCHCHEMPWPLSTPEGTAAPVAANPETVRDAAGKGAGQ